MPFRLRAVNDTAECAHLVLAIDTRTNEREANWFGTQREAIEYANAEIESWPEIYVLRATHASRYVEEPAEAGK